jgi:plastocyanin
MFPLKSCSTIPALVLTEMRRIRGKAFSLVFSISAAFMACVPAPVLGASTNVDIVDFSFNPASVTVHVNDSVIWTWIGPTVHTATSDTGLWDSGLLSAGSTKFTHTFTSSGSFPYFCEVHPFMTASVTVQAQTVNVPPTVSINSPANGATFAAPWTGTIQATVGDSDGTVTQVVFMAGSAVLGTVPNPPSNPSIPVTNLAAGNYSLTAVATDNAGAFTTSAAVNIIVGTETNQPPPLTNLVVQLVSGIAFNRQTGLFEQSVSVNNPNESAVAGVRLAVLGLPADVKLYDASGSTNGTPFVEYKQALNAGASVDFRLEYYRSNRLDFISTNFVTTAVTPVTPVAPIGSVVQLDRTPFLFNGSLVIEFASVPGKTYVVEYSPDMQVWSISLPPIVATGTRVQWIDTGPPKTDSAPGASGQRFYRVVQLP